MTALCGQLLLHVKVQGGKVIMSLSATAVTEVLLRKKPASTGSNLVCISPASAYIEVFVLDLSDSLFYVSNYS
jgi:hypothetical protein